MFYFKCIRHLSVDQTINMHLCYQKFWENRGNPLECRQNYVKTITSNAIGYIWEIQTISTKIFILAQAL